MTNTKTISTPPRAGALVESLRGMGYTLATAVADIIDNSIAAGARRIDVRVEQDADGHAERLLVIDDGAGMDREGLIRAMALGSVSPTATRSLRDLGRFGLGLKTATFSQCRRLTVASKTEAGLFAFAWDLDLLAEADNWDLIECGDTARFEELISSPSGTVVMWERLDRALGPSSSKELMRAVTDLRNRLRLVFHRFLADGDFVLRVNSKKVTPLDPFFSLHPAKPHDFMEVTWPEIGSDPKVRLRAFVIPDPEDSGESISPFGPSDELDLQGFFIYRGKRLISAGGWLNLRDLRKAPEFKLARIRVDFSNTDDVDWRLDIRKSMAVPPREMRDWLRLHAVRAREISAAHLTAKHPAAYSNARTALWTKERGSMPRPDVSDPVLAAFLERLGKKALTQTELIGWLDILAAAHPTVGKRASCEMPGDEVFAALRALRETLSADHPDDEIRKLLEAKAPFSYWPAVIHTIFDKELH